MALIRTGVPASPTPSLPAQMSHPLPITEQNAPPALTRAPGVEQTVRAWHQAGHGQRAIARELGIDRRKVKHIIAHA